MLRYVSMTNQSNTIRIIAGTHRSRKVAFPDKAQIRPTGDRIRETLFNWIQQEVAGALCLDLFAGSGALGIEALSRSAGQAIFVETDPIIAAALSNNLKELQLDNSMVYQQDAQQWIESNSGSDKFNIVFLDPPFDSELLGKVTIALERSSILANQCLIYVEQAAPVSSDQIPSTWKLIKEKKAGNVFFYLYIRNG